jgi:hypothetical protein
VYRDHAAAVTAVAFSADGNVAATGDAGGGVEFCSMADGYRRSTGH